MYSIFFGISVGICEYFIDRIRGKERDPINYIRDSFLVGTTMGLMQVMDNL